MNEPKEPNEVKKTPPLPPTVEPTPPRDTFEPMEGAHTVANTFDTLLKRPGALLHELCHGDPKRLLWNLVLVSLVCLALFGVVIGLFSGEQQLWAAPLKIVLGVFVSGLITLPSLYIFSCLNGLDVSGRMVLSVMIAAICLTALLLLGLTPVAWIFSQSTTSVGFMGFLVLGFWGIALSFGLSLVFRAARLMGVKGAFHLGIWTTIFVVVTLQMATSLRPIVGTSGDLFTTEKKFFVEHWFETLNGR